MDKPVRVLVADDSEIFRELLSKIIASEAGFEVVAAAATETPPRRWRAS